MKHVWLLLLAQVLVDRFVCGWMRECKIGLLVRSFMSLWKLLNGWLDICIKRHGLMDGKKYKL